MVENFQYSSEYLADENMCLKKHRQTRPVLELSGSQHQTSAIYNSKTDRNSYLTLRRRTARTSHLVTSRPILVFTPTKRHWQGKYPSRPSLSRLPLKPVVVALRSLTLIDSFSSYYQGDLCSNDGLWKCYGSSVAHSCPWTGFLCCPFNDYGSSAGSMPQ